MNKLRFPYGLVCLLKGIFRRLSKDNSEFLVKLVRIPHVVWKPKLGMRDLVFLN